MLNSNLQDLRMRLYLEIGSLQIKSVKIWSHWSGVSLIPMTAVFIRRGDSGPDTEREPQVNTKADTVWGGCVYKPRDPKDGSEPPETEGGAGTDSSSQPSEGTNPLLPGSGTSGLQNRETIHFYL